MGIYSKIIKHVTGAKLPALTFSSLLLGNIDLDIDILVPLEHALVGSACLGFAESPAARAQVKAVRVDEAILLERLAIPLGAGDGVDVEDVHGINLLERAALGFDHEEVDDDEEREATSSEYETVVVVNVVGDHGTEEGDQEVEQPVRS